jgi:hypothetical protein
MAKIEDSPRFYVRELDKECNKGKLLENALMVAEKLGLKDHAALIRKDIKKRNKKRSIPE